MGNIFSRLRKTKKLSMSNRHELLLKAIQLHSELKPGEVEQRLLLLGATITEAESITGAALERYEQQLSRNTSLPESSQGRINYYFFLGVTPKATPEEIQKAYRRKAKAVHPDRHIADFDQESWAKAMTILGDAKQVLTDPEQRRAYDALCHQKSRQATRAYSKPGEKRGDWDTRYRWDLAEIGQLEESILEILQTIEKETKKSLVVEESSQKLNTILNQYEGDILELRTQSYALPDVFFRLSDQVRQQMQRKDRLIKQLHALLKVSSTLPDYKTILNTTISITKEVREKHHLFDISPLT